MPVAEPVADLEILVRGFSKARADTVRVPKPPDAIFVVACCVEFGVGKVLFLPKQSQPHVLPPAGASCMSHP